MKFLKIAGVATVVVIALAVLGVTLAFAQKPSPTDTPWWNTMRNMMQSATGRGGATGSGGMMGGNFQSMQQMHDQMTQNGGTTGHGGMMGGNGQSMQDMHNQMAESGGMGAMHEWMHQPGGVHDSVWKALAEKLGLTTDELTAQVNDGKTLAQIAEAKGVAVKDLAAIMETGMKTGLEQAVKDGKLTQEQADLMLKNMNGQYEWMITNMGAGMMSPGGMMGPNGGGMMGPNGSGGCHDNDNTNDSGTSL